MPVDYSTDLPVIALSGTDDALVQEHAHRYFAILTEGSDEFSHEIIDGTASLAEEAAGLIESAKSALQTSPLFGGTKVVWLKGASFLGDTPLGRAQSVLDALDDLLTYLSQGLPPSTYFLISAYEWDKRRSFYQKIKKIGRTLDFEKIDPSKEGWEIQVSALARNAAKERKLTFSEDALNLFIHRVSESSRQIFNELDKLDMYLGLNRRHIEISDVELLAPLTKTGVIFEIGRALEKGNTELTLKLINHQLDKGEQPVAVMRAAIIPIIRNLFLASTLTEEFNLPTFNYKTFTAALSSLPPHAQALIPKKKDGSLNPFSLFSAAQQLRFFPKSRLRSALKACFDADKALVTSTLDSTVVLHRLVVQLTERKR